jgi:hypothetical protein
MAKPPDMTQPIIAALAPKWKEMACVIVIYKDGQREIFVDSGVTYKPNDDPGPKPAYTSLIKVDDPAKPDDPCVYYQFQGGWESVCW